MNRLPAKRRHTRITTRRTLKQAFRGKRLGMPRQFPVAVLTSRERAFVLEMIESVVISNRNIGRCKAKVNEICFRRECVFGDEVSTKDLRMMETLYKRLTNGKTTC